MGTSREDLARIEELLEEVRAMVSPPAVAKVEELVRHVMRLYGDGLRRIGELLAAAGQTGETVTGRLIDDDLVANLLIVHGLHPDSVEIRVARALDRVRPYLGSHGGDVEIVAIDDEQGVVRLRMQGSCDGCPSSILTVKLAVEGAVMELAPEIERVEVEGVTDGVDLDAVPGSADWFDLTSDDLPANGQPRVREIDGVRILVCRVDGKLYAYQDGCPHCSAALANAHLDRGILDCPDCGARYDLQHAGKGVDGGSETLVPVPLLESATGVQVALGEVEER